MSIYSSMGGPLWALASAAQRRSKAMSTDPESLLTVVGVAVAVLVGFFVLVAIVKRFLFICGPQEILVFSGRSGLF